MFHVYQIHRNLFIFKTKKYKLFKLGITIFIIIVRKLAVQFDFKFHNNHICGFDLET